MTTVREQQPEPVSAVRLARAVGQRLPDCAAHDLLVRYFRTGWHQEELADRVHAMADAFALQAGWTVTRTAGRFGLSSRTYRDPRFDQLHAERTAKGLG